MQVREYIKFYYIETETESFPVNLTLRTLHVDMFETYDVRKHKSIQLNVLDTV